MGVRGEVREPMMKKLVFLPFSITCASQASVMVLEQRARRSRLEFKSSALRREEEEEENDEGRTLGESLRHSSRFSRPNLSSNGVSKFMKAGFKNLSLLFNEDEMEELGMEMEIGCPTDVKHVTHIGWNDLVSDSPDVSLNHHFQLPTTSPTALRNELSTFGRPRDGVENMSLVPVPSMSCVSEPNVVVPPHTLRRSKSDLTPSSSLRNQLIQEAEARESISSESMRHSSKPNLSTGVNKLMKGFKSLSQLFVYEDEMKEISMEMEIGCPTDVKHVTHIGLDGLANDVNPLMEWDKLIIPELLSQSHTASVVSFNNFSVSSTVNATSAVA